MKVSIIGAAGTVGSCTAFYLACKGLADEIVMFDLNENLLKSHFLDLTAAASNIQYTKLQEGLNDKDLYGSDVVIMSASVPYRVVSSRLEFLYDNIEVIKETAEKIKKFCPDAIIINATNPVDPLNYAMYLCVKSEKKNFIGYTLNDSIRFRMFAAEELGKKAADVEGMVIGEHGENQVPLFSTLKEKGKSLHVQDDIKRKVKDDMANVLISFESLNTGRTAGWTSAVGLSFILHAIYNNTKEIIPCSAVLSGEFQAQNISIGVPVSIGKNGIERVVEPQIKDEEKEQMQKAIAAQEELAAKVEDYLQVEGGIIDR